MSKGFGKNITLVLEGYVGKIASALGRNALKALTISFLLLFLLVPFAIPTVTASTNDVDASVSASKSGSIDTRITWHGTAPDDLKLSGGSWSMTLSSPELGLLKSDLDLSVTFSKLGIEWLENEGIKSQLETADEWPNLVEELILNDWEGKRISSIEWANVIFTVLPSALGDQIGKLTIKKIDCKKFNWNEPTLDTRLILKLTGGIIKNKESLDKPSAGMSGSLNVSDPNWTRTFRSSFQASDTKDGWKWDFAVPQLQSIYGSSDFGDLKRNFSGKEPELTLNAVEKIDVSDVPEGYEKTDQTYSWTGGDAAKGMAALLSDEGGYSLSYPKNQLPTVSVGGPYSLLEKGTVELDGSGSSDPDGEVVGYSWSIVDDSTGNASLSDAGTATPVFHAPAVDNSTEVLVSLDVEDDEGDIASDNVAISVEDTVPDAVIGGPYSVSGEGVIELDGSGSSVSGGEIVGYSWSIVDDPTGNASLSDSDTPTPVFHAPSVVASTEVVVNLRVEDGTGDTASENVKIVIESNTLKADAGGPYTVIENGSIELDGSGSSDPDGKIVRYSWSVVGDPTGTVSLTGSNTATPVFHAPSVKSPTEIMVRLEVEDDSGNTASDSVVIVAGGMSPEAAVGGPYSVLENGVVELDGSGSSDPDGEIVSYSWSIVNDPTGNAYLLDAESETPAFYAPGVDASTEIVLSLEVEDDSGYAVSNNVTVLVKSRSELLENLENISPENAVELLAESSLAEAVDAMGKASKGTVADILEESGEEKMTEKIMRILNLMDSSKVAAAIHGCDISLSVRITKLMFAENVFRAAKIVDRGAKLDLERQVEIVNQLSPENAADLLLEIYKLPKTPEIAADLLEAVDGNNAVKIVEILIGEERFAQLNGMFHRLSDERLNDIYGEFTVDKRATLYYELSSEVRSKISKNLAPYFEVENLDISKAEITPGEINSIFVTVTNNGGTPGAEILNLEINGTKEDNQRLYLRPEETETLSFEISRESVGTYSVEVRGQSEGFEVREDEGALLKSPLTKWIPITSIIILVAAAIFAVYHWQWVEKSTD